jgi:uncharacterized protein YeeX (DUF496 family)
MTQATFEEWLEDVNHVMRKQNQKILLLVDSMTSHCVTKMMSNIKVKFLPPNLTSEVQPLDQGVIRAVKSQYHQQMLQYIVTITETNNTKTDFNKSVSVFYTVWWLSRASEQISRETIVKNFQRAGCNNHQENNED